MFRFVKKMPEYKKLLLVAAIIKTACGDYKAAKIENGTLFCTDSKRALIIENFTESLPPDFCDGFYIVAKFESDLLLLPVEKKEHFPNPERIIPKDAKTIQVRETTLESAWIHSVYTDPEIRPLVDIDFLNQFYKTIGFLPCVLHYTSEAFPIMLESENMKYIVMPMSK